MGLQNRDYMRETPAAKRDPFLPGTRHARPGGPRRIVLVGALVALTLVLAWMAAG